MALDQTTPPRTARGRSAGEAELAAIDANRPPSLKGRILGPVAALVVTVAVWVLLATSLATALLTRPDGRTT